MTVERYEQAKCRAAGCDETTEANPALSQGASSPVNMTSLASVFSFLLLCQAGILGHPVSHTGGSAQELQDNISHSIEAHESRYTIPPGSYNFSTRDLVVSGATDFHLYAAKDSVLLIFQPGRGVNVVNGTNVVVEGLRIDYDTPCFSQGEVDNLRMVSKCTPPELKNTLVS